MNLSQQLATIKKQLQQNKNAFKKNKQNFSITSNYQKPLRSNADLKQIKKSVQSSVSSMITTKKSSSDAYDCLVKRLKLLLQQAWTKNQFLVQDRADILRENMALKQTIEELTKSLDEAKQLIGELKLNGYSGNQVNGMFDNGDIFKIGYQSNSRPVSEKEHYSIQDRQSLNYEGNSNSVTNSQNRHNQLQNYSPSSSQNANQQSQLIRQVSAQFLPSPALKSHNLSPTPQSYRSSQINQTPNYNFRLDMQQNINPIKNHYVDIGSEFISYNNSCNGSGSYGFKGNNEVEISLNNINNELYLPINQNKQIMKQEIQTFKEHLYMVNGSQSNHQQSVRQSQENMHIRTSNQLNCQQHQSSQSKHTQFIYCSSTCQQGIFRAFYLSMIKYPSYREKFFQNLQELLHDDTFCLFALYPKNHFWIQMIGHFLQQIQIEKPSHQQVLKHINSHKLIDMLLIQALKYRVQWLYNDCPQELNESSLLNGSINQNNNQNSHIMTNRQSVNVSFQQTSQQHSQVLQFFTALCNDFGLECKKDQKAFCFYEIEGQQQSRARSQGIRPLFAIVSMEEMKAFGFEFSLYYEKSQTNGSRVYQSNFQEQMSKSQQMNQFSNSVKKNFKNIEIDEPISQEKSSQNSNLLNSYNNSSNGKYMEDRSFISQTNEYEEEDNEQDASQDISYVANTNLHKFNCTTRNITEMLNSSSNDNTLKSLRMSIEDSYDMKSERGRELRQRPINYNTMSYNYPIHEELIQTEGKQILQTSFGKSINISNMSSLIASPHVSNNASKVLNEKKQTNEINCAKPLNIKGKQRYANQNLQNQNFIIKQVKSSQSQDSDSVINDYEDEQDDQYNWKCNIKLK